MLSVSGRDLLFDGAPLKIIRLRTSKALMSEQRRVSSEMITHANGYMLASTRLQCPPPFGPNMRPEGDGSPESPGILWWLEHIRNQHTGAR